MYPVILAAAYLLYLFISLFALMHTIKLRYLKYNAYTH